MHNLILIMSLLPLLALAEENLKTIEVLDKAPFAEYWEENKSTNIYSGKKNTVTSLKQIPQLQTNNYRQATAQTPGLLISEIPNESLAAITYRGLGNPHESYNVLLLQDGLPVAADMYGYPAHYFSPALPMMEKVQFIRGGGSLIYGPQPGGVLNYMSVPLHKDQLLSGKLGLTGGSYKLISSNNALYGSKKNNTFAIEYYRRQGDGPQRINSNFVADYLQIRNHHFAGKNKYKFALNGYNSDHGETGGFSKIDGPNKNVFGKDLGKASKRHDRLKVSRVQFSTGLERRIDETSELQVNLWANAYNRYSKRQRGGEFGTFPIGANADTNDIVTQKYYGFNGEVRYLKNYTAFGNEHTFSGGYLNFNLISPMINERGDRADANSGDVRRRIDRETTTNSFFAENRFSWGKFMITPGVRFENIKQTIDERKNVGSNIPLRENEDTVNLPLFGIGLAWHVTENSQFYGNVSEAYKPVTFGEAVPTDNSTDIISEDIDASKIINYEIGYRGQTTTSNWDISAFLIRYENKFGRVGNEFKNTGASIHKGIDLAGEIKLSEIFSQIKPSGDFNLYGNVSFLDARYTWGPQKDKTPQYAPKTITRAGLIYGKEDKLKVALMGVMVGRHYGDDNNGNGGTTNVENDYEIPFYAVWDLTADWNLSKSWMLSGGINNLLNREYFSRVRSDGVIWAIDRNYYAGVTYKF